MTKTNPDTPVIERRAPVDSSQVDQLLAILTRNVAAYETLYDSVPVSVMNSYNTAHGLIWKLVRKHSNKYGLLPQVGHLRTAVAATLADNPDAVADEELDKLNELVEYIYDDSEHGRDIATSATSVRVAVDTARDLLLDQQVTTFTEEIRRNGQIPVSLPSMLTQFTLKMAAIDAMGETEVDASFPEGWDEREKVKLFSCGIPILDTFMGGGWRGGECVLFMGPYGSCKTTLVVHGVSNSLIAADKAYREAKLTNPDAKRPVVFLMFTEGTKDDYRMRLLSNMAKVPWSRLNKMERVMAEASRGTRPGQDGKDTEYELALFPDHQGIGDADEFFNEYKRIEMAVKMCNKHLVLLDCTGNVDDPRKNVGGGGVIQLANVVRAHLTANQDCEPMSFWLDHASALASRMAEATDANDDKAIRLFLKNIPRLLVDKLANPFRAPVMVVHQLAGEANSRKPTGHFHHTDSADCKSIAEFVTFAVVTGPPDSENLCKFECTKHRREPPAKWRVARIRGDFNEVVDVSKDYRIDEGTRRIRSIKDDQEHGGKTVSREIGDAEETAIHNLSNV